VQRSGFTLIELLVAVTLLIMLLAGTSYIFDITVRAMDEATAINEMTTDSPHYCDLLRKDIRGIETRSFLILGYRQVPSIFSQAGPCYASHRMHELGRSQTFRCDWMEFYTNTEQTSVLDMNAVGQWARVFWGHGPRTGPATNWSTWCSAPATTPFATDWIVMRHQILLLGAAPSGPVEYTDTNDDNGRTACIEASNTWGAAYQLAIKSLYNGNFGWYGEFSGGSFLGNRPMTDRFNTSYMGFTEQTYWHDYIYQSEHNFGNGIFRLHAVPHCGTFMIQYAMPGDLRAGPGGTILWRDPDHGLPSPVASIAITNPGPYMGYSTAPAVLLSGGGGSGATATCSIAYGKVVSVMVTNAGSGYTSPPTVSFSPGGATAVAVVGYARTVFSPVTAWPVLLKVTMQVFDPKDRVDKGRTFTAVAPVAR
jgi:prepilin-type N-terminal cleavage/methylation domain-containing protein